jgi:hypothetical protein
MHDFDPCPVCRSPITKITGVYVDGETYYGLLDLGWRIVSVTDLSPPRLVSWELEPCGCMLPRTEWNFLSMPDEPIHWMHPDELDRFINDRQNTHGT